MTEDDKFGTSVLLDYYKMQVGRSEHYESQLLSIVRLHFTLVAVLLAVAGYDRKISGAGDVIVGTAIISVGVLGLFCVRTYSYRCIRHGRTARQLRIRLDDVHGYDFESARTAGKAEAREKLGLAKDPSIRRVWRGSYLAVIVVGLAILAGSAISPFFGRDEGQRSCAQYLHGTAPCHDAMNCAPRSR